MMIRNKGGMHGFTLVEIVIIIVVITILSLIGMVSYNGIRKNAAKSAVVSALSDAQKKLELEYAQTRTTMGELPEAAEDVTLTRIQKEGVHYSNLSAVQNGVLFHMICRELVADPYYSVIHGRDGHQESTVVNKCDDNVFAGGILITGWNSITWSVPIQKSELQSYIDGVPEDAWWIDRQDVIRGFYSELMRRFESRGGTWPIYSFWNTWAAPDNSGVPYQPLPEPDPPEEGVYCIQGVYADFPDMVFIITDQDGTPREGNCPTS